jgi:hypothetical protein
MYLFTLVKEKKNVEIEKELTITNFRYKHEEEAAVSGFYDSLVFCFVIKILSSFNKN